MNHKKKLKLQKKGRAMIEEQFLQKVAGNYHIAEQIGDEISKCVDEIKSLGYIPPSE